MFESIKAERVDAGVTVQAECLKAAIKHRSYKGEASPFCRTDIRSPEETGMMCNIDE